MTERTLSIPIAILVVNLSCAPGLCGVAQGQTKSTRADRVKAAVAGLGTGFATQVEVDLGHHHIMKGYINEAKENDFVVIDPIKHVTLSVPYSQVRALRGHNVETSAKASVDWGKPSTSTVMMIGALAGIVIFLAVAVSSAGNH